MTGHLAEEIHQIQWAFSASDSRRSEIASLARRVARLETTLDGVDQMNEARAARILQALTEFHDNPSESRKRIESICSELQCKVYQP